MKQILKSLVSNVLSKLTRKKQAEDSKVHKYTFRGKEFYCDEDTIFQLNYALALNKSKERYERVDKKK